jgi:hypothetical protein
MRLFNTFWNKPPLQFFRFHASTSVPFPMGPAAPSADNQEILGRIPKKGAVPVQAESEKHRANLLLLVRVMMPLRPGRLKKFCSLGSSTPKS